MLPVVIPNIQYLIPYRNFQKPTKVLIIKALENLDKLLSLWIFLGMPAFAQITVESGTTMTVSSGTTVDITGSLVNNGTIDGKGTINVSSNYTGAGTFAITIGPSAATHTTLAVTGTATISSGSFSVTHDSYTPSMGDNATIITSSTLSGTFSNASSNNWNANYN